MYDYVQLVFVDNTVENTQILKNMIFSALVCILCICIGCREMLSDSGWGFKFFDLTLKAWKGFLNFWDLFWSQLLSPLNIYQVVIVLMY